MLMERMCPVDLTTGKGLGSTFNETYFSLFEDAINYITVTKGVYALIDPHNYMVLSLIFPYKFHAERRLLTRFTEVQRSFCPTELRKRTSLSTSSQTDPV
jgi:hypothetical protein